MGSASSTGRHEGVWAALGLISALLVTGTGCGRLHFEEVPQNRSDAGPAGRDGQVSMDGGEPQDAWIPAVESGADASGGPRCGNGTLDSGEQCDDGNAYDADACSNACVACSDPSNATCWDISGVHTTTQWEISANHVFGHMVTDGQVAYGVFDGTSDAPQPPVNLSCPPFWRNNDRPIGWEIWRTAVGPGAYQINVSGRSDEDCARGQPIAAGEIQINGANGWRISSVASCVAREDTEDSNGVLIPTWCTIDTTTGNISWQAGSQCGGCCACPDGARVDIQFTVSRP